MEALSSLYANEPSYAGEPTLQDIFDQLEAQLTGLENSKFLSPTKFGAIPNDPTAAVANVAALTAWLNAGAGGILLQNPNDVFYVVAIGGGQLSLKVNRRGYCPLLRLKVIGTNGLGGAHVLDFSLGFENSPGGSDLVNAPVTKGQTTFALTPPGNLGVIVAGSDIVLRAGGDEYDIDRAPGWWRRVKVTETTPGSITTDSPSWRAHEAHDGGGTNNKPRAIVVPSVDLCDDFQMDYLEMDFSEMTNVANGPAYSLNYFGCVGTRIGVFHRIYGNVNSNSVTCSSMSEQNVIGLIIDTARPGGRIGTMGNFHDTNNRVENTLLIAETPNFAQFREGFAGPYSNGPMHYECLGSTAFTANGSHLIFSISESEPALFEKISVSTKSAITQGQSNGQGYQGFWLGGISATASQESQIIHFQYDKDWKQVNCAPHFVNTPTICGRLQQIDKDYGPQIPDGTAVANDAWIGRIYPIHLYYKTGGITNWQAYLYTPPFVGDGFASRDIAYPSQGAAYAEENLIAQGDWVRWINKAGFISNVAFGICDSRTEVDRYFKLISHQPATDIRYLRTAIWAYPMRRTFVNNIE